MRLQHNKQVKKEGEMKQKMTSINLITKDLTNKDLNTLMKPLKRKGDPANHIRKNKIPEWYKRVQG